MSHSRAPPVSAPDQAAIAGRCIPPTFSGMLSHGLSTYMHIHPAPTHGYLFTLPSPARAGVRLPRYVEPGIVGEMFTQGWLGFPPSKRKHGQASPPTLLRRMPRLRTGWTEADGFAALVSFHCGGYHTCGLVATTYVL